MNRAFSFLTKNSNVFTKTTNMKVKIIPKKAMNAKVQLTMHQTANLKTTGAFRRTKMDLTIY